MQADTRFAEAVAEHGAEASNISFKNILFAHHRILEPKKATQRSLPKPAFQRRELEPVVLELVKISNAEVNQPIVLLGSEPLLRDPLQL